MGGEAGGGGKPREAKGLGVELMEVVRGTIVGLCVSSGLLFRWSSILGLCRSLISFEEVHDLGGDVGLKDELDNGETSVESGGGGWDALAEVLLLPPCMLCCMRQWILNQLDRRPYLDPDLDIPTIRHFRNRQALQAVRFFLLMTHR